MPPSIFESTLEFIYSLTAILNVLGYIAIVLTIVILYGIGKCDDGHIGNSVLPFTPYCVSIYSSPCNLGFEWAYASLVPNEDLVVFARVFMGAGVLWMFLWLGADIPKLLVIMFMVVCGGLDVWFFVSGFGWTSPLVCANPALPHRFESLCSAQPIVNPPRCLPRKPLPATDEINICVFVLCINFIFTGIVLGLRARVVKETPEAEKGV